MKFEFQVDFEDVAKALSVEFPRQVPFAMARTLTALAKDAKDAILTQLPVVFDRPTGFTLNAVTTEMATKMTQESRVFFKESETASGKAKNEHIRPGAQGAAARSQKKTEYLLTRLGDLPPGWVTVPGKAMPLDGFGNLAGAYYKQIVNVLQLKVNTSAKAVKGISKASQRRAVRMGAVSEMFTVTPGKNTMAKGGGWLPPGVYKHLPGRKLLQMLKFVRKASYKPRLDMQQVVSDAVTLNAEARWAESSAFAIGTATKGAS